LIKLIQQVLDYSQDVGEIKHVRLLKIVLKLLNRINIHQYHTLKYHNKNERIHAQITGLINNNLDSKDKRNSKDKVHLQLDNTILH
jgi:hypothetical protein